MECYHTDIDISLLIALYLRSRIALSNIHDNVI